MFNNLIESSSHRSELKRRGSFFLFTTAMYVVLFAVVGVASIFAYDARLEEPPIEIVMVSPLDYQPPAPVNQVNSAPPPRGASNPQKEAVRETAMASVNQPQIAPKFVSAQPNRNLPVPQGIPYKIGRYDADPDGVPGSGDRNGRGIPGSVGDNGTLVVNIATPPAPPIKKATPRVISRGPITGEAIFLPKPAYPRMAKEMRIQGSVGVQVLIDESGKVVSAKAVSGNPALVSAAQRAALDARFSPTKLGGEPVKVSGVITYNFVLQ